MKRSAYLFVCIFSLALFALMPADSGHASEASHSKVVEGRTLLFGGGDYTMTGLLSANTKFLEAVTIDPNDSEARLFLSLTRIPALMDTALSYTSGAPIENFQELFDNLGVAAFGRDILNWSAKFSKDINGDLILPPDVMSLQEFQNFVKNGILQEVDSALADLGYISDSFTTDLSTDETGNDVAIEVDYADVLLYKTSLYTLKTFLQIILSYDINITNLDQLVTKMNDGIFNINDDLLDFYPTFFTLLADGASSVQSAKDSLVAAIDTYNLASEFIRNETDDQDDDLIVLNADTLADELDFRSNIGEIKNSIVNKVPIEFGDSPEINFSHIFEEPVVIRNYLPTFSYDPYTNDLLSPDKCTVVDKTFSGILPNGLDGCEPLPGDVDHSGSVDLRDVILSLKVLAGENDIIFSDAAINFDSKIGLEEVLYLLKNGAEIR